MFENGSYGKGNIELGKCLIGCLIPFQLLRTFLSESSERGVGGVETPYELSVKNMKPRKFWSSLTVLGVGHSVTAATLASSMATPSWLP